MLGTSASSRRFSHAFLDCLSGDGSGSGGRDGGPTSEREAQEERFALIVVNGEVGHFLPALWRHGQSRQPSIHPSLPPSLPPSLRCSAPSLPLTLLSVSPLLPSAALRLCADGGADRVYAALPAALRSSVLPDRIVGDMDSASADVLDYYGSRGVAVVREAEQLSTDLQKAIRQLGLLLDSDSAGSVRHVVVYGAFGGRFDQLVGNLVTLHSHQRYLPAGVQMLLLSEGNLAQLLPAGQHVIAGHPAFEGAGKHCGLMALQGEVKGVWTSGLTWDLQGQSMGWDATMSTSNVIRSDDAQVAVSIQHGQLVWTTEFSSSASTSRPMQPSSAATPPTAG